MIGQPQPFFLLWQAEMSFFSADSMASKSASFCLRIRDTPEGEAFPPPSIV